VRLHLLESIFFLFLIHYFHCALVDCWDGLDSNGCVGVRVRV